MYNKQLLRFLALMLLAAVLAWPACKKVDFDNPELADHTSEFAFPLFSTTLNLKDLMLKVLNDTLSGDTILVNPDNSMTLFYSGDVAQKPATDIFADFTGGLFPLIDTVSYGPLDSLPGVSISRADLKKGKIGFTIYNSTADTITGYLRIPQMSKDGNVFTYPFIAPKGELAGSSQIDLTGYILASDDNTLEFIYYAYKPDGSRIKIPDFFGVPTFIVQFDSLEFSYLQGFWANQRYSLIRDTIEIDINQTNLVGDVRIENPKVTMRIANSWGFPTRGVIKYLSFIGQNGEEIPLESTVFVDSAVDFNYPQYALNEIGQTKYTDITLDSSNSNISQIFNSQPTRLIYEVDGISNALDDPTIIGFLTDSSVISLSMRVELVLEGSAKNFGAEQTLDLDFGDLTDLDTSNIESVEFKLVSENGIPISSNLQMYFLDENGVAIDSLFESGARNVMEAAPVNSQGVATGIQRTEHFIEMSAARFERVRQAKQAFLKTFFTTAQGGTVPVKLLTTNSVTVKMGIKARTRF